MRFHYRLPDGNYLTGPLPAHVQGHFGPTLKSYVLYQHYQNHVTQPLIREELLVLDRPEIPLHNNLSENDIREWANKRKISPGTRRELGRRCRDVFLRALKSQGTKPEVIENLPNTEPGDGWPVRPAFRPARSR